MGVFTLAIFMLGIAGFVIWIWALIDCLNNEPSEGNDKIVWLLVILLAQLPGAIIYFVVQKTGKDKTAGEIGLV